MSLSEKDFTSVAYGNGTTLWVYNTGDTIADLSGSNYFGSVSGVLSPGDIIFANTNISNAVTLSIFSVVAVSNGNVTISTT